MQLMLCYWILFQFFWSYSKSGSVFQKWILELSEQNFSQAKCCCCIPSSSIKAFISVNRKLLSLFEQSRGVSLESLLSTDVWATRHLGDKFLDDHLGDTDV